MYSLWREHSMGWMEANGGGPQDVLFLIPRRPAPGPGLNAAWEKDSGHQIMKSFNKFTVGLFALALLAPTISSSSPVEEGREGKNETIEFTNAREQAQTFMDYYATIKLTKAQDGVKRAALEPLPAACCSNNSAYTCCCECNLSRTVWGLSHFLIAKKGADAEQVQDAVKRWIRFVAPDGFSGDACFKGGCVRPMDKESSLSS